MARIGTYPVSLGFFENFVMYLGEGYRVSFVICECLIVFVVLRLPSALHKTFEPVEVLLERLEVAPQLLPGLEYIFRLGPCACRSRYVSCRDAKFLDPSSLITFF